MYNILVVEDEYLSREGIKSIIKENFENVVKIFEAENGIEAKSIIDKNHLDIILLDINIPGINGIDLCKYIKSKYMNQNIIVITAYDDLSIKNKMIDFNINKYLVKPVRPYKLIEVLKSILPKQNNENQSVDNISSNSYVKDI
ncbi:MAG: response regulator, partial [Peptostreptococcaceae bacterium]